MNKLLVFLALSVVVAIATRDYEKEFSEWSRKHSKVDFHTKKKKMIFRQFLI